MAETGEGSNGFDLSYLVGEEYETIEKALGDAERLLTPEDYQQFKKALQAQLDKDFDGFKKMLGDFKKDGITPDEAIKIYQESSKITGVCINECSKLTREVMLLGLLETGVSEKYYEEYKQLGRDATAREFAKEMLRLAHKLNNTELITYWEEKVKGDN